MSAEITISASLTLNDTGQVIGGEAVDVNVSGTERGGSPRQSVGTSIEAIALGALTTAAGALCIIKNRDSTNYVEIHTTTSSNVVMGKVPAGERHIFRFGSSVTAPAIIANTAAVLCDITLIPA